MYRRNMENFSNAKSMQGQQRYPLLYSFSVLMMATLLTGGDLQSAVVEAVTVTFFVNFGACEDHSRTLPHIVFFATARARSWFTY
jgi:hypothetical protein